MEAAGRCRTRRAIRGVPAHRRRVWRFCSAEPGAWCRGQVAAGPELRAQAAGQLRGGGADWEFERRQGSSRRSWSLRRPASEMPARHSPVPLV